MEALKQNSAPAEESNNEITDSLERANKYSSGWDEVAAMADKMAYPDNRETKQLEQDMANARDIANHGRRERFRKQRTQEIVERELNSKLLKIDQLEQEILAGNPELSKESISFEDDDITVYNLRGIPFSLLSTTIDFKKSSYYTGSQTYRMVMEHPEMWTELREQAESSPSFGTTNQDARGNTISTSYYNSEYNLDSYVNGELIYGFDHVDADSIITIKNSDASTGNKWGNSDTKLDTEALDAIKKLEGPGGDGVYNEVCLRRYSETGLPKKPDYIIAVDGKISDVAKRHAKFFGIPIVNIDSRTYRKKMLERGEAILDSISESDSYADIDQKYSELYRMSVYKGREDHPTLELQEVGSGYLAPQFQSYIGRINKDTIELELSKRLEFIKQSLQKAITHYKEAKEHYTDYIKDTEIFPDFNFFRISLQDTQHENGWYMGNGRYDATFAKEPIPGDCSQIKIEFQLKDSSRTVKTIIHDGERKIDKEEALIRGYIKPDELADSDSSIYDALAPIVRQYFDAKAKYKNAQS